MTCTIAALTSAQDGSYYTAALPSNYYIGEEKERGVWWRKLAEDIGLKGEVRHGDFIKVLDGISPSTGKSLVKQHKDRVPGVDLTFTVPKSVSAAYAVGDADFRQSIEQCVFDSISETLTFLEGNAKLFRSGRGGHVRDFGNIAAAIFQHVVSRNGDPNLHFHCVIPNLVKHPDGRVQHLNTKALFKLARTLGPLFRAALAKRLGERMDLSLQTSEQANQKRGWFELKGVPEALCKLWSSRSREINEFVQSHNESRESAGPAFRAAANKATREHKSKLPHIDILHEKWRIDARDHSFSIANLERGNEKLSERQLMTKIRAAVKDQVEELTQQQSRFFTFDLLRGVAERLQDVGIGAQDLKERLDTVIKRSRQLIQIEGEGLTQKLTSKRIWKLEESLIKDAERLKSRPGCQVDELTLRLVLNDRTTISGEQADAVRTLTQSKGSLRVMQGVAGAGKTYTLDTVREAFEKAGCDVMGAAVSGLAKEAMATEANLQTRTVKSLLMRIQAEKEGTLSPNTPSLFNQRSVLILDEASMIDTQSMREITRAVKKAKATLILVGDDRQLQAIGIGGAFKYFLGDAPLAVLSENRRQIHQADREAVSLVRAGKIKEAMENYLSRGRLNITNTRQDAAKKLIAEWSENGGVREPKRHSIFTETRREAQIVNQLCQQVRIANGQCDNQAAAKLGETRFYKGDRVLFNEADRTAGIQNGYRGEVLSVDEARNSIRIRLDQAKPGAPRVVQVSMTGKTSNYLSLGYAATTHKMQGQTTDFAYVLLGGGMSDNAMTYTQLTRGKHATRLYGDKESMDGDLRQLYSAMNRDRTKTMAHQQSESQDHPL